VCQQCCTGLLVFVQTGSTRNPDGRIYQCDHCGAYKILMGTLCADSGEGFAMFCWFRHRGPSPNGLSDAEYSRLAHFWWITGGYR
jgi:hypothetical protein